MEIPLESFDLRTVVISACNPLLRASGTGLA
jgi:hypothetical protein